MLELFSNLSGHEKSAVRPIVVRGSDMGTVLFNIEPLIKQTKTVLKIYRRVMWALSDMEWDLHGRLADAGWNDYGTGITYLTTFVPDIDLKQFEARVCRLMESKSLMEFIDASILRLGRYPKHGAVYHDIVYLQYLAQDSSREPEILEKLCLERSTFYRRKREALYLLGLCLFGLLPKGEDTAGHEQMSMFVTESK